MRKFLLLTLWVSLVLATVSNSMAQTEMLVGGNMELQTNWSISELNSQVSATTVWNYTESVPANGAGGCLKVSATVNNQTSQYVIYQAVTLSSDFAYQFDGAFKDIGTGLSNFWCEVYIGAKPVNGADYGAGQAKIAQFNTWESCSGIGVDGTFKNNACTYGTFVPQADGEYYLVVKIGNIDWESTERTFSVLLDELSLIEMSSVPLTAFSANETTGYLPFEVQFTDESEFAESWLWNFGDGTTSTDQNPLHTYTALGTYTVSLKATNANGDSTLTKSNYITVKEVPELPVDGKLIGGNMEDASKWSISYLNTPAGVEPTAQWNYTTDIPGAGKGGCLYVSGAVNNNQTQYCIYQPVTLSNDRLYEFNGAVKDISENLTNSWIEVFIGTKPVDGEDYGTGQTKLAVFSTWNSCTAANVNGTFQEDGCFEGAIIPDTSGQYYFVLKVGIIDWESTDRAMDILIDQLSLVEATSKPLTAFSADNLVGFAPLTVNFTENSKLADSWAWDFGDGATSTEQNPTHVFTQVGKFTVSLTATNEQGDSTVTKTNYIVVNEQTELPDGEKLYGGNMENPDFWNITTLNATTIPVATWNYTANKPTAGVGGNLHVTATVNNTTSHYCIWQPVDLLADSAYVFDGLFKDVTGVDHFWTEVYIGTVAPVDGSDYNAESGAVLISYFNTWEGAGKMVDGAFSANALNPANPYNCDSTGTYYFVLKLGNTDWEATNYSFEVILDELTLKETTPVVLPEAEFFADVTSGGSPLTVQFYNQSKNAESYVWYFGDGTTSTETEPSHTYTKGGSFTVSLVAINESARDSLAKADLIVVTGLNSTKAEKLAVYPNPSHGLVYLSATQPIAGELKVFNIIGEMVYSQLDVKSSEPVDLKHLPKGIYILKLDNGTQLFSQKVVIE